jgi:pimeloyl-ACP methyl ester carboxylesterase
MPVTVMAGERDARYVALADDLVATLPQAELVIVPGAGHGLPREAPEAIADVLARG